MVGSLGDPLRCVDAVGAVVLVAVVLVAVVLVAVVLVAVVLVAVVLAVVVLVDAGSLPPAVDIVPICEELRASGVDDEHAAIAKVPIDKEASIKNQNLNRRIIWSASSRFVGPLPEPAQDVTCDPRYPTPG